MYVKSVSRYSKMTSSVSSKSEDEVVKKQQVRANPNSSYHVFCVTVFSLCSPSRWQFYVRAGGVYCCCVVIEKIKYSTFHCCSECERRIVLLETFDASV